MQLKQLPQFKSLHQAIHITYNTIRQVNIICTPETVFYTTEQNNEIRGIRQTFSYILKRHK